MVVDNIDTTFSRYCKQGDLQDDYGYLSLSHLEPPLGDGTSRRRRITVL